MSSSLAIAVGVTVALLGMIPAIVCRERHVPVSTAGGKQRVLSSTLEFLRTSTAADFSCRATTSYAGVVATLFDILLMFHSLVQNLSYP